MSKFDHVEAHVLDVTRYCHFLRSLFEGGSFQIVSQSGTSMFVSPDGINIEVKRKKVDLAPEMSGFCNPCLRRSNPKEFIQALGLEIESEQNAPFGKVYFFKDHEGVTWHIKDLPE